jgi:hypothetical protein
MSSMFGGARRREDPELRAANRRSRIRLARDINDQRTLTAAGEEPIRRGNHWMWLAVAVVVAAVLALASGRGGDVEIVADCDRPAIAVESSRVVAGTALRYRLTGADDTRYVVTFDGEPVRGDAGSTVSYVPTPAGPALELRQCLSPTLVIPAPAAEGQHELAVLEVAGDGSATEVTSVTVTVVRGQ